MRAFQVLWTTPLSIRTLGGHRIEAPPDDPEEMFSGYYLLTMILSALQWKRLHSGTLKLYGDAKVIDYLSKFGLLDLWDEHDLETFAGLGEEIDSSCFTSAGKYYAFLKEPAPCAMVDLDLIVWRGLAPLLEGRVAAFTHWEETQPPSYWYGTKEELKTPPGYEFRDSWDWGLMAANTSFVYFADEGLKNYYASEVIRFMVDNEVGDGFHLIKPELLIEQRLLPMVIKERGLADRAGPLIDAVWSAAEGRFTRHDARFGEWQFYRLDNQPLLTHLWIAKQNMEKNQSYLNYYCYRLLDAILSNAPRLEAKLRRIGSLREHLARYELGLDDERNRGQFSTELFPAG
jgi:hypothetical protein